MHHNDRRRYEMLVRVRDFGSTYGHLFPESTLAPQAFAAVTTALDDIETADVAESTASVSARATRKQDARRALQERLLLIVKTAQVLPGTEPAFRAHFRVPASRNDQLLLTTARQCRQRAAPVAGQFVAHGMSPAFLGDLDALIERFEEALRDRGMSRDQLVEARGRSRQALANAFQAIGQLDVIVANHLAADPIVREVWKRSRRVAYPAKPRRGSASDAGSADNTPGPPLVVTPAPAPATA